MKVMILAAGRGERMRQLTNNCPKPLLKIAGRSIIERLILTLKKQGFNEFVINIAYLGQQIKQALGSGEQWGVQIEYSDEGDTALETGGGIFKALPLLGNQHFLVVNADVWAEFPYNSLMTKTDNKIHLLLVNNPPHHPEGDFSLKEGLVVSPRDKTFTYSGIGVFHPAVFAQEEPGIFPLAPIIRRFISRSEVSGELLEGEWIDVGTPERLAHLAMTLKA
mgnify:FL=1